jgi:hypothetical protein
VRGLLALGLVFLLLVPACGGMDDEEGAPATEPTGPAETTEAATTTATTTEAAPEGPRTIRVAYRGGKVSGDTGTVRVSRGTSVRLVVRADVEDEVHVHGYDLTAGVAPGHPARIEFEADQRRRFIVELEHLHLHLFRLRVAG